MARKSRKKKQAKSTSQVLSLFIFVLVALVFYFFVYDNDETPEPTYSAEQNSEGYYYYQPMTEGLYASANNLILNALKTELNLIVNEDKVLQSYDDARQSLAIID